MVALLFRVVDVPTRFEDPVHIFQGELQGFDASSICCLALALAWLKRVLSLRASLFFSLYLF
jgi:hypothetical protein